MRRFLTATALMVGSFILIGNAHANPYLVNTGGNSGDGGWSFFSGQYFAGEFTLAQASTITGIEAYLSNSFGSTGGVTAEIDAAGGNTPGSVQFSTTFTLGGGSALDWYGAGGLNWNLDAGTYWVAFVPDSHIDGAWNGNAPSPLTTYAQGGSSGWQNDGPGYFDYLNVGVRISGGASDVPEPASIVLLGMGLAGLKLFRKRG